MKTLLAFILIFSTTVGLAQATFHGRWISKDVSVRSTDRDFDDCSVDVEINQNDKEIKFDEMVLVSCPGATIFLYPPMLKVGVQGTLIGADGVHGTLTANSLQFFAPYEFPDGSLPETETLMSLPTDNLMLGVFKLEHQGYSLSIKGEFHR